MLCVEGGREIVPHGLHTFVGPVISYGWGTLVVQVVGLSCILLLLALIQDAE
jgi:hypothetical protein